MCLPKDKSKWVIMHGDFYTNFMYLLQASLNFLYRIWNSKGKTVISEASCGDILNMEEDDDDSITRGKVEMVIKKLLGRDCDPNGDMIQETLDANTIATIFEKQEPSLEEIKQSFDVFDENGDGFIDAKELNKIVCALGFNGYSQMECNIMIRTFDQNGDGRIDFDEFIKLMECF